MAQRWIQEVGPEQIVINFSGLNPQCYSLLLASYLCWLKQTCGECYLSTDRTIIHFLKKPMSYNPKIPENILVHAFWILFRCQKCFKHQLPTMTLAERQKIESPVMNDDQKSFTGECLQCHSSFVKTTLASFPNQVLLEQWLKTLSTFNWDQSKEHKQERIFPPNTLVVHNQKTNKLIFPLPLPSLYMQFLPDYSIGFGSLLTDTHVGSVATDTRVFCNQCETYGCEHGLCDWRPKPVGLIHSSGPKPAGLKPCCFNPSSGLSETKPVIYKPKEPADLQVEDIETFGSLFLNRVLPMSEIKVQEPNDLIWKTPFDSKQRAMMHVLCSNMTMEQQSQFIMNGLVYFLRVELMEANADPHSTIQSIFSTILEPFEYYFLKSRVHRCHMFHSMMTWSARNKLLDHWKPLQYVFECILGICGTEGLLTTNHVLEWFEWDKKQMPHRLPGRRLDSATWFCNEISEKQESFLQVLKNSINEKHKRQKHEQKEEIEKKEQKEKEKAIEKNEERIPQIQSFLPFQRKRKREESDDELTNVNCMQVKYVKISQVCESKETDEPDIYDISELQKYQFKSDTEEEEEDEEEDNPYTLAQRIKQTRRKNKRKRSAQEELEDC